MKILVLTQLYHIEGRPELKHDTSAIHYLVKNWTPDNEVLVINTYINYRNTIFRYLKRQDRKYFLNDYYFEKDGVKVWLVENQLLTKRFFQKWNWKYLEKKVQKIIEKENFQPDLVISHFPCYSYGYIDKFFEKVPKIAVLHQSDIAHAKGDPDYLPALKKEFDGCFCRSTTIRSYFEEQGMDNLHEEIIYSGAPTEQIDSSDIHKTFNKDGLKVFYAGKFMERKHVDWIIKCIAKYKASGISLRIAGSGELDEQLHQLVSDTDTSGCVTFLGQLTREQTLEEMKDADIFCMPSTKETFGLVYLEAMASGCITIGTKGEGIDGVMVDGENGFLINGYQELEDLFGKLINDYSVEDLRSLSERAIESGKYYSEENMSKRYLDIVSKVEKR